jgi:hypothetical protein
MKNCPYCAEQIQDAAIICRFCKRDLSTATAVANTGKGTVTVRRGVMWALLAIVGLVGAFFLLVLVAALGERTRGSASARSTTAARPTEASTRSADLALL